MENEITELEIQKKNKQRVSVFLDDKFAFALDIMAASSLSCGQKLSENKISELKAEDEYNRGINYAFRYLANRARSIKEMETYLAGKKICGSAIIRVIEKLEKERYLNDTDFSKMWIESRTKFNPKGAWALRYELRQKGVSDNIIENSLLDHDDNIAAWDAVKKKLPIWKNLEREKFRHKLYTFLSNRGFNYETTSDIYDRAVEAVSE